MEPLNTHIRKQGASGSLTRSLIERLAAAAGLLVCSPVLLAAGACIVLESGWPVIFSQERVGQCGSRFRLVKLRSMRTDLSGAGITASGDARITKAGAFLRKYKIDELPQLWNILAGQMQWIGPRPEVPAFVNPQDPLWRMTLSEKPGLTDLSSLVFRNEEEILATYSEPARAYCEKILPCKLTLSARYLQKRTFISDCKLLFLTVKYSFCPAGFHPDRIRSLFVESSNEREFFYSFPSSLS